MPSVTPFPASPEDAAQLLFQYVERGQYDSVAGILVDSRGNSLNSAAVTHHVQLSRTGWGARPDITITSVTVVAKVALTAEDLHRLGTGNGYRLTVKTEGTSRTPCFKLPQERGSMVVVAKPGGWRVVEEMPNEYVPSPGCGTSAPP